MRAGRGAIRTSILSLATLLALAAVAVIVLVRSVSPPENVSSPGTAGTSASTGPEIRGTISIATDLAGRVQDGSVLFIVARKGPGPPFAVKRIVAPRFPLTYRIGPEDVMLAGSPFEGEVRMSARLSRAGSAGPPQAGDLEGEYPVAVRVGTPNANIEISHQRREIDR